MTINAHFDGRAIVPDEPLDLPLNQAIVVRIEPVMGTAEGSALSWLEENAFESSEQPVDLAVHHDHYLYGVSIGDTKE